MRHGNTPAGQDEAVKGHRHKARLILTILQVKYYNCKVSNSKYNEKSQGFSCKVLVEKEKCNIVFSAAGFEKAGADF